MTFPDRLSLGHSQRAVLGLLPLLVVLTSCGGGSVQGADGAPGGEPAATGTPATTSSAPDRGGRGRGDSAVPVTTAKVQEMALPVYLQAVGNVEAFSTVDVRPQVSGPLLTVNFVEGQEVEKGQLLFTIDPRPFDLALRQAQAQLAKDTGQSKTAETQRARYAALSKSGLVSQEQFDAISAQANSLQSTLAADQVQIDNAQLQLQYTRITAPIAGRTGALQVHAGSLVRTGDAVPMVVINQVTPVNVTFSLPSSRLPEIRQGQARGPLPTEALPSKEAAGSASVGTLAFIDNSIDQTTSGIRLKSVFPNGDRRLWPGEYVQVRLRVAVEPRAIVVPLTAIQNGPSGQYVYVTDANRTVAMRPVKVSRTESDKVVVSEGLQVGEEVVTDGHLRLTPGARISVTGAAGASAP